jgi:hypothetical protein
MNDPKKLGRKGMRILRERVWNLEDKLAHVNADALSASNELNTFTRLYDLTMQKEYAKTGNPGTVSADIIELDLSIGNFKSTARLIQGWNIYGGQEQINIASLCGLALTIKDYGECIAATAGSLPSIKQKQSGLYRQILDETLLMRVHDGGYPSEVLVYFSTPGQDRFKGVMRSLYDAEEMARMKSNLKNKRPGFFMKRKMQESGRQYMTDVFFAQNLAECVRPEDVEKHVFEWMQERYDAENPVDVWHSGRMEDQLAEKGYVLVPPVGVPVVECLKGSPAYDKCIGERMERWGRQMETWVPNQWQSLFN